MTATKTKAEKLIDAGQKMQKAGGEIQRGGSAIMWFVVALLLLIFIGIPALLAAFS